MVSLEFPDFDPPETGCGRPARGRARARVKSGLALLAGQNPAIFVKSKTKDSKQEGFVEHEVHDVFGSFFLLCRAFSFANGLRLLTLAAAYKLLIITLQLLKNRFQRFRGGE